MLDFNLLEALDSVECLSNNICIALQAGILLPTFTPAAKGSSPNPNPNSDQHSSQTYFANPNPNPNCPNTDAQETTGSQSSMYSSGFKGFLCIYAIRHSF